MNTSVIKIDSEYIEFDNGIKLFSEHEQDCCESHYLSFADLTLEDFKGMEFNLDKDDFFERIEGYGIALKPLNNFPVRIPGYASNNGYYSSQLELCLQDGKGFEKTFDITKCQNWDEDEED